MALLAEYLNENQHRSYPLADAATARDLTDSMNLPQSLMADMVLNAPESYDGGSEAVDMAGFFVSNVLVRSFSVDITISYQSSSGPIEIAIVSEIPMDADVHTSYNMSALPQANTAHTEFEAVSGSVTVGLMDEIKQIPGSWSFDLTTGNLIISVIHAGLVGVRQITVGADTFSGNVILKEGTNVVLDTSVVGNQTIITISSSDATGTTLQSDADILAALEAEYGQPLTHINGVQPAADGNFSLVGLDCTVMEVVAGGISVANPCSQPCCDKSFLDAAYANLAELNSRYARIIDFYTEVRTNINAVTNKLAMLQLNTNIDV